MTEGTKDTLAINSSHLAILLKTCLPNYYKSRKKYCLLTDCDFVLPLCTVTGTELLNSNTPLSIKSSYFFNSWADSYHIQIKSVLYYQP